MKDQDSYRKFCSLVLGDGADRNHIYFRCRFPEAGEYFLKLFGRYPSIESEDWTMFAFYMVRVPQSSKRKYHSPKCTSGYFGLKPALEKPTLLVSHRSPYFYSKENKIILTLNCEKFRNEIRMNFFYLDTTQGSRGAMTNVNNLLFYDRFLAEKQHIQCDIEMMSRGIHVLEIFRRKKTTKKIPKPLDPDEELLKILDDESQSIKSGFSEEFIEKVEIEDEYIMTYGIDYIGREIPNSEVCEFPDILPNWSGRCKLFEPRIRFLPALKTILFRIAVPWAKEVWVKGRETTKLERQDDKRGIFSYNVLVGMFHPVLI